MERVTIGGPKDERGSRGEGEDGGMGGKDTLKGFEEGVEVVKNNV